MLPVCPDRFADAHGHGSHGPCPKSSGDERNVLVALPPARIAKTAEIGPDSDVRTSWAIASYVLVFAFGSHLHAALMQTSHFVPMMCGCCWSGR